MEQDAEPRLVIRQVPLGRAVVVICLSGELDFDTVTSLREEIVRTSPRPLPVIDHIPLPAIGHILLPRSVRTVTAPRGALRT
ncbi:hypothetical protein [Streptomyces sp. NPDC017940]|uniref:hypothetical protein n=1 Tax=Streptomyces sp. NPDC017940 TaxID=3365017 RepID=UPI0037AA08EF